MSVRDTNGSARERVVDGTSSTCLTCGHTAVQHDGGSCDTPGWASWVRPCACPGLAFPVGEWAWPTDGRSDCTGCGHAQAAHANGAHCHVAAADEWDDCRCTGYRSPRAVGVSAVAK